jgi:uncharacterized repeat protein (TIGR03803 family)
MTLRSLSPTIGGTLLIALLVFTVCGEAQTPALKTLYAFTGDPSAGNPMASVAIGSGRVLYGTTPSGGTANYGTVFSLTPPASSGGDWTEALIYDFSASGGVNPNGLTVGAGGVLYGTTSGGCGTVFSLTPPTSQGAPWTLTVLHSFTGGSDACEPYGTLAAGGDGVLYGTTYLGGTYDTGAVFALRPPASPGGAWTEGVLYSLPVGSNPEAGVAIGSGGVLYGTTTGGGPSGNGLVYSLTPPASPGGAWTEAALYAFSGRSDGGAPFAAVAIGSGGVLYGTTASNYGTVFSLTPPASPGGAWTHTVLHNFTCGSDGCVLFGAGVAIGSGGVLYGATVNGGTGIVACPAGCGTVFSLTPPAAAGGPWTETVLHNFTGGKDGALPYASPVIERQTGVLFGTTGDGGVAPGRSGYGTVFGLQP